MCAGSTLEPSCKRAYTIAAAASKIVARSPAHETGMNELGHGHESPPQELHEDSLVLREAPHRGRRQPGREAAGAEPTEAPD